MDSYYEDLVDYLRYQVSSLKLYNDFRSWLRTTKGYCNWSDGADVIDRIIDDIMEQIIEDELLEEELVS